MPVTATTTCPPVLVASFGTREDQERAPVVFEKCSDKAVIVFVNGVLDRALERATADIDPAGADNFDYEWACAVLEAQAQWASMTGTGVVPW